MSKKKSWVLQRFDQFIWRTLRIAFTITHQVDLFAFLCVLHIINLLNCFTHLMCARDFCDEQKFSHKYSFQWYFSVMLLAFTLRIIDWRYLHHFILSFFFHSLYAYTTHFSPQLLLLLLMSVCVFFHRPATSVQHYYLQ